jgi:hypothetical protein
MNLTKVKTVSLAFNAMSPQGVSARYQYPCIVIYRVCVRLLYGLLLAKKIRAQYPQVKVGQVECSMDTEPQMHVAFHDASEIGLDTAKYSVQELVRCIEKRVRKILVNE